MIRWWKLRKMRWAVRRHRRIHRDGFLVSPCMKFLMARRLARQFSGAALALPELASENAQGSKIVWPGGWLR